MVSLELGLDVLRSYKRLPYTPWHALAEFVDNSTQSYINNKEALDKALHEAGERLTVSITYDRPSGLLRIVDNAMGMSLADLQYALKIGQPPAITSGRSKYGLGMKMAACWFGDSWTIRTKQLGESIEHQIDVSVEDVAQGNSELPYRASPDRPLAEHYTVIEIRELNRQMHGRTLGKIREFLSSMYRVDIRNGDLCLEWQGDALKWEMDEQFAKASDGSPYRRDFRFDVGDKVVFGWVGVLDRGSRAKAGFSILHANRVIKGWPESWRPQPIFGQIEGSNDLVNQRLTGEVHLDPFVVNHTKDGIQFMGDEEELVEDELKEACAQYREFAKNRRRDPRPPSDLEVQAAVDEFQSEIESPELVDTIVFHEIPPDDVVDADIEAYVDSVDVDDAIFRTSFAYSGVTVDVRGILASDRSPNDPYVVAESTHPERVLVVINFNHPHMLQINGSDNLANYFRHCMYDAIAEWQARNQASTVHPGTIRQLKDRLLRVRELLQINSMG